jgi:photoactive yellow protein
MNINQTSLLDDLEKADNEALDAADFGIVRMRADGTVIAYNTYESLLSGLLAESVMGKCFFTEVAPCTNNFMVAERFSEAGALDVELNYVFTYRMKPTKVFLRLLRRAEATEQYLLTFKSGSL